MRKVMGGGTRDTAKRAKAVEVQVPGKHRLSEKRPDAEWTGTHGDGHAVRPSPHPSCFTEIRRR
jgi:hypothetical protein